MARASRVTGDVLFVERPVTVEFVAFVPDVRDEREICDRMVAFARPAAIVPIQSKGVASPAGRRFNVFQENGEP